MNECIFCKIMNGEIPSYTIYEDEDFKVFLDINPIANGHMLIVPKKHIDNFLEMDNDTLLKLNSKVKEMTDLLKNKINPDGIKLVNNYGCVQDVKHYHLHIIPCYENDQKIIPVEEIFNKLTK